MIFAPTPLIWLFIDGKLAIDAGGPGRKDNRVNGTHLLKSKMASLGLVKGNSYEIAFFYANRSFDGYFNVKTNIPLSNVPAKTIKYRIYQ